MRTPPTHWRCWIAAAAVLLAPAVLAQVATEQPAPFGTGVMGEALIQYDSETGTLIVITDPNTNAQLGAIVDTLDRPAPQVSIDVVIAEVTHVRDLDLGAEFSWLLDSAQDFAGNPTRDESLATGFGVGAQNQGAFYRFLDQDLEVTLRGLAEAGSLEILSRPSVLARNNESAMVLVGQEVPFVRNSRITEFGQVINTVEYEEIGIILEVTPFVNPDNVVEMTVYTEISTLSGESVPVSAGIEAPVFAKRSAETRVAVPGGQTVVLGGLIEDNDTVTRRGVPLLSKIPVLGLLFQQKIHAKSKTELLVFLTPQVVRGGEELVAFSIAETQRADRIQAAFSEQLMDRKLDTLAPRWSGQGVRRGGTLPAPRRRYEVESRIAPTLPRPLPGHPKHRQHSSARYAGDADREAPDNPARHPGGYLYRAPNRLQARADR